MKSSIILIISTMFVLHCSATNIPLDSIKSKIASFYKESKGDKDVAADSFSDSICHDLCVFFATKKIITEESIKDFENNYCSLVVIWDILKKDDNPNLPDLSEEFGIYKFDYIGSSDKDAPYVLIKNGNSYKIFLLANVSSIINELLKVKEEKDAVINDDLFIKYLKALTGFGEDKFSVSLKVGSIEYVVE